MLFHGWLQSLRSVPAPSRGQHHHGRRASLRVAAHRPSFEVLEARCLLSFSPAASFPVGTGPRAMATGDFNNDGRLDVATVNGGDGTLSVLLGDGQGGFGDAKQLGVAKWYPRSLAVADFNRDGNLDLVI